MSELQKTSEKVFCVIAGGGPVGLITAIELGRRGVRCVVLNDQLSTPVHPKSNAIGARTMEHFRRYGIASSVRAAGMPADHPTDVSYVTRLDGLEIGRLEMPSSAEAVSLALSGRGEWDGPEPPHRLSQIYLEKILLEHARQFESVEIRFGHRVLGFVDNSVTVRTRVENVETGEQETLVSEYLVGADGGRSTVRKVLGVPLEGESGVVRPMMGGSMLSIYFNLEGGARNFAVPMAWQYWVLNQDLRALIVAIDGKERFCMHVKIAEDQPAESIDQEGLLRMALGGNAPFDIISSVPWTAGYILLAKQLKVGRVLLAGDAAHLFTPTGGLGMNTGVEDAVNLGWKLAAVANGWGHPRLLESYESDRLPMAFRSLQFSRGFANSIGNMLVGEAIEAQTVEGERQRSELSRLVVDHARHEFVIPGIVYGIDYSHSSLCRSHEVPLQQAESANQYVPRAHPGARAPHVWLDRGLALFDQLGKDFTLLVLGSDAPSIAEFVAEAALQKVPLKVLPLDDSRVVARYEKRLVLIGPDGHIFWRSDSTPKDVQKLIGQIRGVCS